MGGKKGLDKWIQTGNATAIAKKVLNSLQV